MDYNFLGYWGNALNDTSVLITMTLLDTILGISWRVKKRRPIISNVFFIGFDQKFGLFIATSVFTRDQYF